jgi:hypothetical protein
MRSAKMDETEPKVRVQTMNKMYQMIDAPPACDAAVPMVRQRSSLEGACQRTSPTLSVTNHFAECRA